MRDATVVVSGATGFVGARVVERLLREGASVRALVRAPLAYAPPSPSCIAYACDLDVGHVPPAAFEGATHVLHLAAYIPRNFNDPSEAERCLRVNALGTLAMLEAARAGGVTHFTAFSSANAYAPTARPAREEDALYPADRATYYLASKACGETYVEHARRARGLATCVLRLSAVYGPGMPPASSVMTFARRLQQGEAITVHDGGRFTSDLVHVDDVVAAALTAAKVRAVGPLNVGSGVATSTLTLAITLAELTGANSDLVHVQPEATNGAPGFSPLDLTRTRAVLSYQPRTLLEGLRSLLEAARAT